LYPKGIRFVCAGKTAQLNFIPLRGIPCAWKKERALRDSLRSNSGVSAERLRLPPRALSVLFSNARLRVNGEAPPNMNFNCYRFSPLFSVMHQIFQLPFRTLIAALRPEMAQFRIEGPGSVQCPARKIPRRERRCGILFGP